MTASEPLSSAASVAVDAFAAVLRVERRLVKAQRDLQAAVLRLAVEDQGAYFRATEALQAASDAREA